jgi:hypothetical protein
MAHHVAPKENATMSKAHLPRSFKTFLAELDHLKLSRENNLSQSFKQIVKPFK